MLRRSVDGGSVVESRVENFFRSWHPNYYFSEASSVELAALDDRGVDDTADEAEHGDGAEHGRARVTLLSLAGRVVDLGVSLIALSFILYPSCRYQPG